MFEYICHYMYLDEGRSISIFADTIQEAEDKFECEYPQFPLLLVTPMGEFSALND